MFELHGPLYVATRFNPAAHIKAAIACQPDERHPMGRDGTSGGQDKALIEQQLTSSISAGIPLHRETLS
jgi:hypothetical protein